MRTEKNLTKKDIFHRLSTLDISPFVVQKQNLDYISWATVQHILCSLFDDVSYGVSSSDDGQSVHRCGTGGEVHVTLCIEGVCHTECFPVMDNRMKSKAFDSIDARDVSDSIKRAYVKAAALLNVSVPTIYNMVDRGELEAYLVIDRAYLKRADVERLRDARAWR